MTQYPAIAPIKCDRCGQVMVCLYTYEDPEEEYLPMIFCSLDCLSRYVGASESASLTLSGGEPKASIN